MSAPAGTPLSAEKHDTSSQDRLWTWLLPLIVVLAAYGMQRSVALLGLDLHHDTFMFDAARRTLIGEVPFRDFFYQYNLGTVFLHVLALKAFGIKIASLKIATAFAYALIALLIYASVAVKGHRRWALGAALLWSTLSPFYMPAMNGYHAWSTVYMMASVMGGALFLVMALSGRPLLWSILAGVCFNLAFWFKQVAGLQILVVLAWIAYNAWRPAAELENARRFQIMLMGYALGGLMSALPFFFYLQEQSLFQDWWRSAFVFNVAFSGSGDSVSGVVTFARTMFPVARDMGYVSVVWALLPLCLLAIVLVRDPSSGKRLFSRSDTRSLGASLFAALGIAGWMEYFPLAHAFHTHLFMAPVFVLLAVARNDIAGKGAFSYRRLLVTSMLILSVAATVYEAVRHLQGLRVKIAKPTLVLRGDWPVNGLSLAPEYARSFESFCSALLTVKREAGELPLIPMSVDPLRALLPDSYREPTTFKMGVDWTWPNEIVEPGFNKLLAQRVAERKSPIYADSLIGIPGYVPVSLLEMPSPITATHTLYIPSADKTVTEPRTEVARYIFHVSNDDFEPLDRNNITQFGQQRWITFLPLDNLNGIPTTDIAELNVSIVRSEDIPSILSKSQYENFLMSISDEASAKVAKLYKWQNSGRYELSWPLNHKQNLELAKFMLSRGKLFEQQDRPMFFTTLQGSLDHRPFLAMTFVNGSMPRIVWAKSSLKNQLLFSSDRGDHAMFFLSIPSGALGVEWAVLYVQIVLKDMTTRNFYLHYLPE